MIIFVMGLPGSGKTFFARKLSKRLNLEYIGSDEVRKKMEAMGKYRMEDKQEVYGQMGHLMGKAIENEKDVIMDATFFKKNIRNQFISQANDNKVPYCVFWIEAPEEIIKERLSGKRVDSEADYEVYQKLSGQFEPPSPPYLKLESLRDNIQEMVLNAEKYINHIS